MIRIRQCVLISIPLVYLYVLGIIKGYIPIANTVTLWSKVHAFNELISESHLEILRRLFY